jgi:hypothetical protein
MPRDPAAAAEIPAARVEYRFSDRMTGLKGFTGMHSMLLNLTQDIESSSKFKYLILCALCVLCGQFC